MTPLIGQHIATHYDFRSPAVLADGEIVPDFRLSDHIEARYALLFFYTMDFSYICPTELTAIGNRIKQFRQLGVEVIAISGDSQLSHKHWRNMSRAEGGVDALPFTLVADISRSIAREYGVLMNDSMSLRASFIIDNHGYFRHQAINDLPIGRNIDELLRIIKALQHHQRTGEQMPAGWQPDQPALQADDAALADYMTRFAGDL